MSFMDEVVVIGHRGAAGLAPENTLESFRRAFDCGVNAVELDVHLVEGELVVIHDDTLERTTNGIGRVAEQTLDALRGLDAGNGARVPLLAEVAAHVPRGVGLNVELKGAGTGLPLAGFLRSRSDLDVLVSSFDHDELRRFRSRDASTPVAPLFHRWRKTAWTTAAELGAFAVNLSRRAATSERFADAAARGLRCFVYTVNDLEKARRLVDDGASGVFTDYPDRITPGALGGRSPGAAGSPRR